MAGAGHGGKRARKAPTRVRCKDRSMTSAPRNENITRAEANARSQSLFVHSYSVDLDLTGTGAAFRSTTT